MKKNLFFICLSILLIGGCKKFEEKPIDTVDERLNATLAEYQKNLVDAPNGWKGYLLTGLDIPVTFLFKFDTKNRVKMASEYKEATVESSFRVKALQRPTLLFDTYSTIHELADPVSSVLGGITGNGYISDFEFAFVKVRPDTIWLEGIFNKNKLILIKSKSEEETTYVFNANDRIGEIAIRLKKYFKRTTIDGKEYEVKFDPYSNEFSLSSVENNKLVSASSLYYVSNNDVLFFDALNIGGHNITSLRDISFDENKKEVQAKYLNQQIGISEALKPLYFDGKAAERWHNLMSSISYNSWISDRAFYVNGIDDYCNFFDVPGYNGLWYGGDWLFGPGIEGLVTRTMNFSAPYVYSATPNAPFRIVDGLAKFTLQYSSPGFLPNNAKGRAMIAARKVLFGGATVGSSEDWYLIPNEKEGKEFDMVRVSDAEAWIKWRTF